MRGLPSRSVVRPAGRKALLPALIAGEPGPRCRSPPLVGAGAGTGVTNRGSASRLPPPSVPKLGFQAALPPAPCTMLELNTGVLVLAVLSLMTLLEPLLHRMLFRTCGLLLLLLNIPPPATRAALPLMVTFVSVGLLFRVTIPPPNVA